MKYLFLFLVFSSILVVINYFRIIKKVTKRKSTRIIWLCTTILLSLSFICAFQIPKAYGPNHILYTSAIVGFCIMTATMFLFGYTALRDAILTYFIARKRIKQRKLAKLPASSTEQESLHSEIDHLETRRAFLGQMGSWTVMGATALSTPASIYHAKYHRVIRETNLSFATLPASFDGLRIVHLTDIHAGNTIGVDVIRDIVNETNALTPDIIVITGDIADGIPDETAQLLAPMRDFKSRYGVYYVTGNHEHNWDARGWCNAVAQLGITVLDNEHQYIENGNSRIAVCGVIDHFGDPKDPSWKSDPEKALNGIPKDVFKIMLAHKPDSIDISFELSVDLVLAGHTHGGQFWPMSWLLGAMNKYFNGLYQHHEQYAYVSAGTCYWGPPFRFGVSPEISLHILHSR